MGLNLNRRHFACGSTFNNARDEMPKKTAPPNKTIAKPAPVAKKKPSLDDLLHHTEQIMTAMTDIVADVKAKEKSMIRRYLIEAEEHLKHAKSIFAEITG